MVRQINEPNGTTRPAWRRKSASKVVASHLLDITATPIGMVTWLFINAPFYRQQPALLAVASSDKT
jgi:hypothetical protein